MVFVTQNIFSKKIFNEAARAEADGQTQKSGKLDKLNLLCYCSGLAFLLTAPIWLLTEGFSLFGDILHDGRVDLSGKKGALDHGELFLEFVFNGIFHFMQNIMAFILLSMVSPVSYSVASLIKRVFVIVVAIVWFRSPTTNVQAFGIGLTFFGLYLYDRASHEDKADRKAKADSFHPKDTILPLNESNGHAFANGNADGFTRAPTFLGRVDEHGKKDDALPGRRRASSVAKQWLPPGTKQELTWEPGDMYAQDPRASGS